MGLGLVGARRLMDRFRIDTAPAEGTVVELEQYVPKRAARITQAKLAEIAAAISQQTPDAKVEAVVVQTLESAPRDATHWSTRSMAQASGLSHMTVQRIWKAFGLEPHRSETFKLSTDPDFV